MIDPIATVIAYLRNDDDLQALIQDQIARRHRFGGAASGEQWIDGTQGLALTPVAGEPPIDAGVHAIRLEARGYGDNGPAALDVIERVRAIADGFANGDRVRSNVVLPDGQTALLYWLLPADSPSLETDPDLLNTATTRMDVARLTLRAAVADLAVA